jgi:hypothetical protein
VHHVTIGQDQAIGREDEAGAAAAHLHRWALSAAAQRRHEPLTYVELYDRGRDPLDRAGDCL